MIDVCHLTTVYHQPDGSEIRALDDVNLHIKRGEAVSIIGPSGGGKSTLLRTLCGLETPTAGQVIIDGEDILAPDYPVHRLHQRMGMVFQQFSLFQHLDLLGNVSLAPRLVLGLTRKEAEAHAMEMLEKVSLSDRAHALPSDLSGGQQQRAAIARCLAMKPDIILFDEPLSALDPSMQGEVQGVIRLLSEEGMTIIVVTHKMRFAHDIATRTIFFSQGRVLEEGTSTQIFTQPKSPEVLSFVKHIQSLQFYVSNRRYDFYDMMTQIRQFCIRMAILEQMNTITHIVEEMLTLIAPLQRPVRIELHHGELDGDTNVVFMLYGEQVSPLESSDVDELAAMIIRGMSKDIITESFPDGVQLTFNI